MTKFAILSDLHMEWDVRGSKMNLEIDPDLFYIVAGDIDSNNFIRQQFLEQFGKNVFSIDGNHDFYENGRDFSESILDMRMRDVDGIRIAGATLWTRIESPLLWNVYKRGLNDYHMTRGLEYDIYQKTFEAHKKFLFESEADIIVSHHCPSRYSISPQYENEITNCGFVTDLTETIESMKKPPKLWICGHTHSKHMYYIGNTLVICNPRGYPNENVWYRNYKPIIVDVKNLPSKSLVKETAWNEKVDDLLQIHLEHH